MMTVSVFDKSCDIEQVSQTGSVDLVKSSNEGFVPNDLSFQPDSFDGKDIDPEGILGKPKDRFEAMRIQDSLADGIRKKVSEKKAENK